MNIIIDRGENDPIPFVLDDVDRAIADVCKHALAEQRHYLNTRDRLQQKRLEERGEDAA